MKNLIRLALDKRGISINDAAKCGLPYQSVYKQYHGARKLSGDYALLYEKKLGIPRSELRPDLWPPEPEKAETCANTDSA